MVESSERIYFEEAVVRKQFFEELRNATGSKSWRELASTFGMRRTVFQTYQYGIRTMSKTRFGLFVSTLPDERQKHFAEQISIKPTNWGARLGGKITYSRHSEIFEKGRKMGSLSFKGSNGKLRYDFNLDVSLSEKLCEFIGAFIGDGFAGKYSRNCLVGFAGDSRLDRDYLCDTLSGYALELFNGLKGHIFYKKEANAMYLRFNSKQLFKFLTERFKFPNGVKCYTVKIPDKIMKSEDRLIFACIRGIFDTDGCVFLDKRKLYRTPYPRITLVTASEPMYLQLKEFLGKFFSLYAPDKSLLNKPRFEITIYGKKQVEKWMNLIGFSNQRHLKKIKLLSQ